MAELTMDVTGMSCGHCVQAVDREVSTVPGVDSVEVDLEGGRVTVRGDVDRPEVDAALREAIERAGYEPAG